MRELDDAACVDCGAVWELEACPVLGAEGLRKYQIHESGRRSHTRFLWLQQERQAQGLQPREMSFHLTPYLIGTLQYSILGCLFERAKTTYQCLALRVQDWMLLLSNNPERP